MAISPARTLRPPAVAGLFYPEDPVELRASVTAALAGVATAAGAAAPKALIVPHAGYVYSGPIAASAYRRISGLHGRIERVVLLGPSHRIGFRGIALTSHAAYVTPLGTVPIDHEACASIAALPGVVELDAAHAQEHSLEVHLPFLQLTLGDFRLLPLVVGDADAASVARVLERLWGGAETLVVVSTDLSHYHPYREAQQLDAATSRAIEQLRFESIGPEQACGCRPLGGLLHLAREHGLTVSAIDLRNSGDTAGGRDRVVGYGAYVCHEHPREH